MTQTLSDFNIKFPISASVRNLGVAGCSPVFDHPQSCPHLELNSSVSFLGHPVIADRVQFLIGGEMKASISRVEAALLLLTSGALLGALYNIVAGGGQGGEEPLPELGRHISQCL